MEGSSNLSNCSNKLEHHPVTSDGIVNKRETSQFLIKNPEMRPFKYKDLSQEQLNSCRFFSCGNKGIDTFLWHGEGLKFQIDRNKMNEMIMATPIQVLGYMAYSMKEATFYVPRHCSPNLFHDIGLKRGDKVLVVHYLGIDTSCQGQGLGTAMIMKVLDFGLRHAKTDPSLRLIVLHATQEACSFYESLGFHRIGNVNDNLVEYAYTLTE